MSLYLRNRWQQLYKNLLHSSIQELLVEDLQTPALIFSPHPDDETLGCGGTIIRKKKLGADVKIIFMTDGSNSHSHLIASEKLKSIRTEEALSAAEKMGLAKEDIYFLEFSDGNLIKHYGKAIVKVKEILALYPGYQLFIPYRQEAPKDHFVTNKIVRNVLKSIGENRIIYEYPIWFWAHFPWIAFQGSWREKLSTCKNTAIAGLGLNLIKNFRYGVDIEDILELKRNALAEHKSQTQQLISNCQWLTLSDVANGEFLDCFFQKYEFFYQEKSTKY